MNNKIIIISNKLLYTKFFIKKYTAFIQKINNLCIKLCQRKIDIYIFHTSSFTINKIGKKYYKQIIKDRINHNFYKSKTDINFPTILSFLYDDQYCEIYISIYNILRKHHLTIKQADGKIKLYMLHSLCNVYQINNYMYVLLSEFLTSILYKYNP